MLSITSRSARAPALIEPSTLSHFKMRAASRVAMATISLALKSPLRFFRRAWQIKKILERNNVEEEGKRNFFNRLEATPVGKLKSSAVGFSAKPISAAISALRHHQ